MVGNRCRLHFLLLRFFPGGRAGSRGSTGARIWSEAVGGNSLDGNSEHCVNPAGRRSVARGAGSVTPPGPNSVTSYYRLQTLVIVMWLVMWLRDHSAKRAINNNILRHVINIMINNTTTTTVTMATTVTNTTDTTVTMETSTIITMDTSTDIIITMATSDTMLPTVRRETRRGRKWTRKRHVMRLLTTPTGKR